MMEAAVPPSTNADRYPEVCPHLINRTPLRMKWDELTMLHWRYPAKDVQALLPDGLTVETCDGSAWVGLVPFQMRVAIPFLPAMKRILHFPETNVRTYVKGKKGRPGVYFWSLEASSLPAVVVARTSYQVPYLWAHMSINQTAVTAPDGSLRERVRYESIRRWPGPKGARSVVEVEVGAKYGPEEATDLDRFLTARWALFGTFGRFMTYANMFHDPWPLHHAEVLEWDDELVAAAGLVPPTTEPLVHYSPGVDVRCGFPQLA